jgi:Fic family protein
MDERQFNTRSPGKLVPIPEGGKAFVPEPLPANWTFPTKLWPLLAEAKSTVSLLEGIGRTLPNAGILLRPLHDREALQSTRLEGTYITAKEFLLFELETTDTPAGDDRNDWREVSNYRRALSHGTSTTLPLSLRLIRDTHEILMNGVRRGDMTPGMFRKHQVAIGSKVNPRFVPPPPNAVAECLDAFEKYLHANTEPDPLIHCFLCHYQFETIHPFHDGNGRVGRLLLGLMLQQRCGLTKPWLYLSDVFERRREEYCDAMFDVSARGNWAGWTELCLHVTIQQAQESIRRCGRLQGIRDDYMQKLADIHGNVRLNTIVDRLFVSPFVRIADLPRLLDITYPTAKSDCEKLVDAEILSPLPNLSPATLVARDVFNVAYDDIGDESI